MKPEAAAARRTRWIVSVCLLLAAPASAETAWVKDGHQINLRAGAGPDFRAIGVLVTGDRVEVLAHGDGWTQVQPEKLPSGWIHEGFLQTSPPARLILADLEAENAALEQKLAQLTEAEAQLRAERETATHTDAGHREEFERISHENIQLRTSTRWVEWITGAGIVLLGMLLGAIVSRSSGRRRQQRIKL